MGAAESTEGQGSAGESDGASVKVVVAGDSEKDLQAAPHGLLQKGASVAFVVETAEGGDGGGGGDEKTTGLTCGQRCTLVTRTVKRCVVCSSYCTVACPIGTLTTLPAVVALLLRCILCQCFCGASKLPALGPDMDGPKLFFDGAGWAFSFNMGVAQYLMRHYDLRRSPLYAVSAGNFAALCVLFQVDPEELLNEHFDEILSGMLARPVCGFCDNLAPVAVFLRAWLPDNAHEVASGRLHVVVSSWPCLGLRFLSTFRSKDELVDAIVASCSFPGFVVRPRVSCHSSWPGTWYDAGLQNMVTPLDYRMDLPVRAFPVPPCPEIVAGVMPCYCGPAKVPSLGPTGEAIHPGHVPVDLKKAIELMGHARSDAARFLADESLPFVKDFVPKSGGGGGGGGERAVESAEMNRV